MSLDHLARFLRSSCLISLVLIAAYQPQAHAATLAPANGAARTTSETVQVIGGRLAALVAMPWQVALLDVDRPPMQGLICGGTLIGARWVLTAAHCFYDEATCKLRFRANDVFVMHSTTDLSNGMNLISVVRVESFAKQFDCASMKDDIALVELGQSVPNAKPIRLSDGQLESLLGLHGGPQLLVSGWGSTKVGGRPSQQLLEVDVPYVGRDVCNGPTGYAGQVPTNALCAGAVGKDSCHGDSGGPLFQRLAGGDAVQYGVVSFGRGCGALTKPGVYTQVSRYLDWINKTTTFVCTPALQKKGIC